MPLNIDWQQILLHLLNFVILFTILYFFLYDPVKKFMKKREDYYKSLDDEANAHLKNSKEAEATYNQKLSDAAHEIEDMKKKARKELDEANAMKLKSVQAEADRMISQARTSIENEREIMLKEAKNEISDMVLRAAGKLVVDSSTSDSYDRFLDAVKGSGTNE